MIAKYLATSLAIENVVNAPRVISLLADLDDFDQLGRIRSRSTMLPASWPPVPLFIATRHRPAPAGRIVSAVAAHGDEPAFALDVANQQLGFRRGFGG